MPVMLAGLLAVVPQDVRGVGRVLDLAGEPVTGAVVTFLARPIPRSLEAGPEDRRVVRTDERGRFRVDLEDGARYTVWAGWDSGASALREGVLGGEFVELRGLLGTGPSTFQLSGTEQWPDADSLRLRAIVGGENIDFVDLTRNDDGSWRLPALPPKQQRTIEVLDGRGEVLWADALRRVEDREVLWLPPPREFDVEVRDESGAPLADVEVRWHIRNYWYSESDALPYGDRFRSLWPVVATTDAIGGASVRVPWPAEEKDLWLMSRKDGFAMSIDGIQSGERFANGKILAAEQQPKADEPIRVTLAKSDPVDVPLRVGRDTALADEWIYLVCRVRVEGRGTPFTMTLPVSDGRARFASPLPPRSDVEIAEIVLAQPLSAMLAEKNGFEPRRVWRLPDPGRVLVPGTDPFLMPDETRVLQVTAADGRPASGVVVFITDEGGQDSAMQRTDRLGRTLLRARQGLRIGVLGAAGFGTLRVEAESAGTIELQLRAMTRLPVRVVDEHGKPVAGVGVRVRSLSRDDGTDDLQWLLNRALPLRPAVTSASDGHLELPLPPFECSLQLDCDRPIVSGRDVTWDPESREVHELVVGPPR